MDRDSVAPPGPALPETSMNLVSALEKVIARNEENTRRIMQNAVGYVVLNNESGFAVATSFDSSHTRNIINLVINVLFKSARSAVRDIDPANTITYFRLATNKYEYLVAPDPDGHFTVVVRQ